MKPFLARFPILLTMFKLILKFVLFIGLILAAGQIPVGKETLGAYYVIALDNMTTWSVDKVKSSKVFAGIKAPKWLEDLFTRREPVKKAVPPTSSFDVDDIEDAAKEKFEAIKSKIDKLEEPKVTRTDRERVMRLLE